MNEAQIIQIMISAAAGLFGVGVGVGLFRSSIKQLEKDLTTIKYKQMRLRGEDNGSIPLYITRESCISMRQSCMKISDQRIEKIQDGLEDHTRVIQALENFARWWMQKEGLTITEINNILTPFSEKGR